ncbi:MAG: hypothetical protein LPJ95_10435 [Paracoccaceae bacterium]|nr:hypothetical protein [Paracoccaceae bacterium]
MEGEMTGGQGQGVRVRIVQSFWDDYSLLDAPERARVDALIDCLRGRMARTGDGSRPVMALDQYRLMRNLRVRFDEILCVTDGAVSLDVLFRSGSSDVMLLGAAVAAEISEPPFSDSTVRAG